MTPTVATGMTVALLTCALGAAVARWRGLPAVLGWLPAAVLAGLSWQSLKGIVPGAADPALESAMHTGAHIGLVLVAAEVGWHVRGRTPTRGSPAGSRRGLAVLVLGPPALAVLPAWAIARTWNDAGDAAPSVATLTAFLVLALSATAVPVLMPIVATLPPVLRAVGDQGLAVAVLVDATAWTGLLILTTATARGRGGLAMVGGGALLLVSAAGVAGLTRSLPDHALLPLLLAGALGAGAGAELAGWHSALGAMIFGLALPRHSTALDRAWKELRPVVHFILLPALVVTTVSKSPVLQARPVVLAISALLLLIALACKVIPALIVARWSAYRPIETALFAALLNARGATEIVIAVIGMEALGIPGDLAFALVIVALVSTLGVAPVLAYAQRRALPAGRGPAHARLLQRTR